jgi:hypothetical protein
MRPSHANALLPRYWERREGVEWPEQVIAGQLDIGRSSSSVCKAAVPWKCA